MIAPDLDRLRAAFASREAAPRPDCPAPDALWEALSGAAPLEQRRALVAHIADCPSCAHDWRLAQTLGAVPGRQSPVAPRWRTPSWLALAAVLLIAVVTFARFASRPPAPVFRAPTDEAVSPLIADDASLPRKAFRLSWSGPPEAVYRLRLSTAALDLLLEAHDLRTTSFEVPADALRGVAPGARLLWQLDARLPDGSTFRTRTFRVRVSEDATTSGDAERE